MAAHEAPRLLVLSHVLPFPRTAGQQQRVFYTLQAARELFHLTFATTVTAGNAEEVREKLMRSCDQLILLPSRYHRSKTSTAWHHGAGLLYAARTGLKRSNYIIGRVEFPPSRMATLLQSNHFDCALFEYWHAWGSIPAFRAEEIPCVLDMHDMLWQVLSQRLQERRPLPGRWKEWCVGRYRDQEERSWKQFDGVVAINQEEQRYVQERLPESTPVFYAPMGTDLNLWSYSWAPSEPMRVAYYGGLGSRHNQQAALRCASQIMPQIWQRLPATQLWLVGSDPPASLRALSVDPRIHVTGYVEEVQDVLRTMSVVLCPWSGTYGFRSRLVEVMGLGVPVVASPDAVSGMELQEGKGLLLGHTDHELASHALRLLNDFAFTREQSRLARDQVERLFSIENSYTRWMRELYGWLRARQESVP